MAVPPPAALEITIWRPGEVSFDDGSGRCETYQLPFTSVTRPSAGCSKRDLGIASRWGRKAQHFTLLSPDLLWSRLSNWYKGLRVCDQIPQSQNSWNCTCAVAYIIVALSLIEQTDGFTFTLIGPCAVQLDGHWLLQMGRFVVSEHYNLWCENLVEQLLFLIYELKEECTM